MSTDHGWFTRQVKAATREIDELPTYLGGTGKRNYAAGYAAGFRAGKRAAQHATRTKKQEKK